MEKIKIGLAALTPERRKEIARMGAMALHAQNKRHQFTHEESVKGGINRQQQRREVKKTACNEEAVPNTPH